MEDSFEGSSRASICDTRRSSPSEPEIVQRDKSSNDLVGNWHLPLGKRNDQGIHECEVWLEEGTVVLAEGARDWKNCTKNPGHSKFVPAPQFSLSHLPEQFRDELVLEYIRILAERTVRLVVRHTSDNRPDGYIFSRYKGTNISHTGTGLVYCYEYGEDSDDDDDDEDEDVSDDDHESSKEQTTPGATPDDMAPTDDDNDGDDDDDDDGDFKIYEYFDLQTKPCPCPECAESDSPKTAWGLVYVHTAKHVVFDGMEAKNTVMELYFNDRNDRNSVKMLYGLETFFWAFEDEERCQIQCVTHDRDVYIKLYETEKLWSELRTRVNEKYWETSDRLAIVVSHPHGWSKQITLGEWMDRRVKKVNESKDELTEYEYDAPTCRGSSGAPVVLLGQKGESGHKTWFAHHHTHSGSSEQQYNISGVGLETFIDLDTEDDSQ